MVSLYCNNDKCKSYGVSIEFENLSIVMRGGEFKIKTDTHCESCGSILSYKNEVEGKVDVSFGRFKSSNAEDKKSMIKKRNLLNTDKDEKRRTIEKRESTMNEIKQKFIQTINKNGRRT